MSRGKAGSSRAGNAYGYGYTYRTLIPTDYNCWSIMSAIRSLRSVAARPAARGIFRPQFSVSTFQHRNGSSKHPKGFEAPTSEDLQELRERVQEFTRREITEEVAAKTDKSNSFPNDMWQKLGDAGFLGITADEDVGGLGMGYQAHCVVMEEISRYFEAYSNNSGIIY